MTSLPTPINPVNPDYPGMTICDLGIGHTDVGRWHNANVFNNFIYEIDDWRERYDNEPLEDPFTCYEPLWNASGWVSALRPNTYLVCYPFGDKASGADGQFYPTGTWVMEFEGSGMMRFGSDIGSLWERVISGPGTKQVTALVTNTTKDGWQWRLMTTDPNNPLKPKAIYLSGTDKEGINPKFVRTWRRAKVQRFMDWQWCNNNSMYSLSGGRGIKVQNADKAFVSQLTKGLVFSGTQSGARGRVEVLDYKQCFFSGELSQNGGWAPSAINGIWIHYTPLNSTYFNYYEPVDFGFSTVRVCKMVSSWDAAYNADRGLAPAGSGEVTIPPTSGWAGWYPMPAWYDPFMNWWQGDGLGNHKNYAMNSDIRQIPVQKIVQICNQMFTDLWINIPHLLQEVDVSAFVDYINDNLHPSLKVYVEYTNEPWNLAFIIHRHFTMLGHVYSANAPLASTPWDSQRRAMAIEAYKRLKIAKQIMSGTRVVETVININSGDTYFGPLVLDWTGKPADFSTYIDTVAIAPYFGNKGIEDGNYLPEFARLDWTSHPDHVYNLTSGQILSRLELTCIPNALKSVRAMTGMAVPRGYNVAIYECGHHLDNPGFIMPRGLDDTWTSLGPIANAYRAKMTAVHYSQLMARMYFYYFAQMGQILQYRVPAVHYNSITRFDMGIFWGLIESYDRLGPKYQGWLFAIAQCDQPSNGPQSGSTAAPKTFTARKTMKGVISRRKR